MSYRANIVGQEHTVADEIFTDESMEKYEAGDPYFIDLYEQINEAFPWKFHTMDCHRPARALADKIYKLDRQTN